jgi:hypothetical protein
MKKSLLKLSTLMLMLFISNAIYAQPSNDEPCNATTIIVDDPETTVYNTGATSATDEVIPPPGTFPDPCATAWCNGDPDVQNSIWYQFVAPANGAVVVTTCLDSTIIDTQVALWQTSNCADFTTYQYLGANDDTPNGCTNGGQYASTLVVDGLTPGETYFVQIDGYAGEEGRIGVQVTSGIPTSFINFIHNSADEAIATVDIRLNGELISDDLAFQTCSTFLPFTSDENAYITVNDASSIDDSNPLFSINTLLSSSSDYIITLTGIYSDAGYTPAPGLDLAIFPAAQILSDNPNTYQILAFHGVTDAPTVDFLNFDNSTTIFNDLDYGYYDSEGYVTLDPLNYSIEVTGANGENLGLTYCAPFSGNGPAGIAFTIVASGFVNPSNNSDGEPFGLFLVNHFDGSFQPLLSGFCTAPNNDNICDAALLIVNDPPATFDNSFATLEEGETSPFNLPSNDPESDCLTQWCDGTLDGTIWFNFVAPASGSVLITTCFDLSIDSQIALCQVGTCSDFATLTYLAQNDDMAVPCTGASEFASEITYSGLTPGETYYIQMDGWEGESGEFQIQVLDNVGVQNTSLSSIVLFPNPAKNQISVSGISTNARAEIRDLAGKLFYAGNIANQNSIDVTTLASGVYFLQIQLGSSITTKMFTIEK